MPNTTEALSLNLRRIRSAKGKTQAEIAEAAGLSRVGYRNIETGSVAPRVSSLQQIAEALDVRLEDLLAPVNELKRVRFRAQKKMTSRETLLANVGRRLEDYRWLESELDDEVPWVLDEVAAKWGRSRAANRAVKAAAAAREAMGIDEREVIRNICGLLEERATKVLTPQVASPGFFGLSVSDVRLGQAVVVNTWERISVERWIFTAAHELGHLILHHAAYDVAQSDEDVDEEREADSFAGAFLMPQTLFEREFAKTRGLGFVDLVFSLKRMFHVSYKTVLYRLAAARPKKQQGQVWGRFYAAYNRRYSTPLSRTDEPEPLPPAVFSARPPDRGSEEPERLVHYDFIEARLFRLVRQALEEEMITLGRAAEILDLTLENMRALSNSWVE